MSRILWLGKQRGYTDWEKRQITDHLRRVNLSITNTYMVSIWRQVPDMIIRKEKTKNKWIINQAKTGQVYSQLDTFIETYKPKVIVINDQAHLWYIAGEGLTLNVCRGMVYLYKNIPCLVLDDIIKSNMKVVKEGDWIFKNDFNKLARWCFNRQRPQPKFRYTIAESVADVREFADEAINSAYVSEDIETVRGFISSISYTYVDKHGALQSFVVPFLNPFKPGCAHWDNETDERTVWEQIRRVHASDTVKIMHNGSNYDCHYFIKFHCPTRDFLIDTQNLMHSIWTEAPKSLRFVSSIALDYVQYWKDENKNDEETNFPITEQGFARYLRYNALDSYYTFCSAVFLAKFAGKIPWTLRNYNTEFKLQMGPANSMAFQGMYADPKRVDAQVKKWRADADKYLKEVRIMAADPNFNPNSGEQFAQILYDVFRLTPIKARGKKGKKKKIGDRTVDEKTLKLVKLQHPIADRFVETVWKYKKAESNISKYGHDKYPIAGRLLYTLSASGTETGRFSGKESSFWVGTQPQNIPEKVRSLYIADAGYFFAELDYAQSDAKFMAFECQDPNYIKTMDTPGLDTHARHAEHFFGIPYKKIVDAHATKEDWVDHPTKGVRQNTKRIVHGSNFQMQDWTLYMTIGKEATVNVAKSLDAKIYIYEARMRLDMPRKRYKIKTHKFIPFNPEYVFRHFEEYNKIEEILPDDFSQEDLIWICGDRLESFHDLYKNLRPWFKESTAEAIKNGNTATCAFGRTRYFFGDLAKDASIQRELSSYYGQGGTAGNINRVLNEIYYTRGQEFFENNGIRFVTQTHDSILFAIPNDKLHLVKDLLTIYEQPVTIHGRSFVVWADAKVGFNWGKMIKWTEKTTIADLTANEREVETYYEKMAVEVAKLAA